MSCCWTLLRLDATGRVYGSTMTAADLPTHGSSHVPVTGGDPMIGPADNIGGPTGGVVIDIVGRGVTDSVLAALEALGLMSST